MADLLYLQQKADCGLGPAAWCLLTSPWLAVRAAAGAIWTACEPERSGLANLLDAGLLGGLVVSLLDFDVPAGLAAGVTAGLIGGILASVVAQPRAGARAAIVAGAVTGIVAGLLAGLSDGLDAGLNVGFESQDAILGDTLVAALLVQLTAHLYVHFGSRRFAGYPKGV